MTWHVSVAALIRRAHELGVIDAERYVQLNKTISQAWLAPTERRARSPRASRSADTPTPGARLVRGAGVSIDDIAASAAISLERYLDADRI